MPEETKKLSTKSWVDIAFKFLAVLVIPLVIWGVKLEISQAVQDTKIEQMKTELTAAKAIGKGVGSNAITLGRVEEKIDATNRRLDDIKADLRRSLPPG
jgi:hypothetical protein